MNNFTELDGVLYFTADDGIHGNELWKSDGTPEGTVLVQDISPGSIDGRPADSNPTQLTAFNGALFFSARSDTSEYGLWRTNGTKPWCDADCREWNRQPQRLLSDGKPLGLRCRFHPRARAVSTFRCVSSANTRGQLSHLSGRGLRHTSRPQRHPHR